MRRPGLIVTACMAAAAAACVAARAQAAESPVLAQAKALCMANHADFAKVLAQAKAQGWTRVEPDAASMPAGEGWQGAALLETVIGATPYRLAIRTWIQDKPYGAILRRECFVSGEDAAAQDLTAAAQAMFTHPPAGVLQGVSTWAYADGPGGRQEFDRLNSPAVAHTLIDGPYELLSTQVSDGSARVLYIELSLAGPPGPQLLVERARYLTEQGKYDAARAVLADAVAKGGADALVALGAMTEHGQGSPADVVKARGYYEQAAARGQPRGRYNLALLYLEGRGVERDPRKALALLEQAVEQNDTAAEVKLGALYAAGQEVEKDDSKAFELFKRAADQHDPYGQINLGIMYGQGRGAPQDTAKARRLVAEAAAQGLAEAKALLAASPK